MVASPLFFLCLFVLHHLFLPLFDIHSRGLVVRKGRQPREPRSGENICFRFFSFRVIKQVLHMVMNQLSAHFAIWSYCSWW